jgi:hypothetical protein
MHKNVFIRRVSTFSPFSLVLGRLTNYA